MLGAIIGDIVGSRFERYNCRAKDFEFFDEEWCRFTDDSVMSLAICEALLESKKDFSDLGAQAINKMQLFGRNFPHRGYGGKFHKWIHSNDPQPYNSFGNGAAMRVSACGYVAASIEEAKKLSKAVTEVTHNHPEGLKGAEATAVAVFLARTGAPMSEIRKHIKENYYDIDFTLDEIRSTYRFDVSCQGSVPQALEAFFESTDFEDAIRNAISIGGDSDTIAAVTGAVAEAYYGIPVKLRYIAEDFLRATLLDTLIRFEDTYPCKIIYNEKAEVATAPYSVLKDTGIKIRKARETDLLRVNELKQQVHSIHRLARPDLYAQNIEPYEKDELTNPFITFLVAADAEDSAVGYVCCDIIRTAESEYSVRRACLFVKSLCVDEKDRRKGIGSALLQYVCAHAKHMGYNSVDLGVDNSNTVAMDFYRHNGFSPKFTRMEKIMR